MDEQALLPFHSSSNSTYFTQKALQAGILKPEYLDSRTRAELRATIQMEMQKERTRLETIEAEIARRRAEEAAELRRRNDQNWFQFIPSSSAAAASRSPPLAFETAPYR